MKINEIKKRLKKTQISKAVNANNDESVVVLPSAMTIVHKTLLVIFFFILVVIIVSSQASMDIVVSARGELLLESDVEKVPHLEGGILDELLVRNGEFVYAGQPIAKIRSIDTLTQLETTKAEIVQQELTQLRYQHLISMTEPDFSNYLINYPELVKTHYDAWQQEYIKNQSNESMIIHDIDHKKSLITSMQNRVRSSQVQLALIREQLNIKKTLYTEGMIAYVDVINMQVQESNMVREIQNLEESLMNERFELDKLTIQLRDLIESRNAEYQTQLIQAENERELKQLSMPQYSDKVERLIVYAPVDGVIDKIHFNYLSAVIPPGESIADIMPIQNLLHGEAKIMRKDMGFVEVGQSVKVKLDTYNFAKYGYLEGKVISISRSSYQEEENEFYLARIQVSQNYLERKGIQYKLSPYMEFTADIKTGTRKLIDYIAKPIMAAIESAFDER